MNLPEEYLKRMQIGRGKDFPAFLRACEAEAQRAIRVNTLKIPRGEFIKISPFSLSPVPWEENGFYLKEEKAGADVYHFAGLYYCQEPSAMCAVPLLDIKKGERVLDLCAAPGGKCTQAAAQMQGGGLLVSNESVSSRAQILLENTERLGVKNAVVFNESAERIAGAFPSYFDKILVDAPCSGEGMFRRDSAAIGEWSASRVARCVVRQREILNRAAEALSAGGRLVYSTCTFEEEENEGQVEEFLKSHPSWKLIKEVKLLPHEVRGEGQYAALLEKGDGERWEPKPFRTRRDRTAEKAYRAFAADFFAEGKTFDGEITVLTDGRMFLLPALPAAPLHMLRAGIFLGEWDGKRFQPAHMLVCCMKKEDAARFISLSREESVRYLRGETLSVQAENGWCAVGVENYPLGLGKAVNGVLKNHFPKGLRLKQK